MPLAAAPPAGALPISPEVTAAGGGVISGRGEAGTNSVRAIARGGGVLSAATGSTAAAGGVAMGALGAPVAAAGTALASSLPHPRQNL